MVAMISPYTVGQVRPGFVAQSAPAPGIDIAGPVKQLTDSLAPVASLAGDLSQSVADIQGADWGGVLVFVVGGVLVLAAVVLYMVETGEAIASSEPVQSGTRRVGAVAKTAGVLFG